ncbi:hypothetical protein PFLUOLIPICF7_07385 [Pseudomonas simiae]|nr:hypothetical protein PFLUOLIPICF7_07385 [Pseudomonas simiae]
MMTPAIQLIEDNTAEYPEFLYYIPLMEKAERNLESHPDICIEICKCLIEGISKTIILDFEPETDRVVLGKMDLSPLSKKAAQLLRKDNTVIEDDFVTRVASVIHYLGVLRNERGDISHGKSAPKLIQSDNKLAAVILQVSSGLLIYLLDSYFSSRRLARSSPTIELTEEEALQDLEQVDYEDYPEFNDWLDEQYPYEGKLAYSFALYSLYYEDYLVRLESYQESEDI